MQIIRIILKMGLKLKDYPKLIFAAQQCVENVGYASIVICVIAMNIKSAGLFVYIYMQYLCNYIYLV